MLKRLAVAGAFAFGLLWLVVGVIYAGTADRIASGVRVAGVDVGGMSQASAQQELERRGAALARVPLPVHVGDRVFRLQPARLGVKPDWAGGAQAAKEAGGGFGPIRGFRRLYVRAFGSDVAPAAQVDRERLRAVIARIAGSVDHPHRDAALRLRGLRPIVVPGRAGVFL